MIDNIGSIKYRSGAKSVDCLDNENCFLLMLVFLRRHYTQQELARMFSISTFSVGNIVFSWIHYSFLQWQQLPLFPDSKTIRFFADIDFKRYFPNTEVLLDGTEIPIQKPTNNVSQRITFSTYKHTNTVKALIAATPGGLISYISEAYGGASSDRQLMERSELVDLVTPNSSIMVDKGFNVEDMLEPKNVSLRIPTFLKDNKRLNPSEVENDSKISSKRVHIERHIGQIKTFSILQGPLSHTETIFASQIIFVCSILVNFRSSIMLNEY